MIMPPLASLRPAWPAGGYIPHVPFPKQRVFLCLDDILEVGYGGSAGGGKSDAILMAALQYVDQPGYTALLVRDNYTSLSAPGALMDRARDWLAPTDAHWNAGDRRWEFPSGAVLNFGYFQSFERDKTQYMSTEYSFIGVDEATTLTRQMYEFLFSRLRRPIGSTFPARFRSGTNPGSKGGAFYAERFCLGDYDDQPLAPGVAFVPSSLDDNPYLDTDEYDMALQKLDPVLYAQLRYGDWHVREKGVFFDRETFAQYTAKSLPPVARSVRYWDLAASKPKAGKDPDYTVGLRLGELEEGGWVILDVVRGRWSPHDTDREMRATAQRDGLAVPIRVEQEPGSAGVRNIAQIRRDVLAGFIMDGKAVTGDKAVRAKAVSSQAAAGNVGYVIAPWNKAFFDELEVFDDGDHDDQVDSLSGAFNMITETQGWGVV